MTATNPKYDANFKLMQQGVACTNERPIPCFSGSAPLAQMAGMTVAEFVADPYKGALASQETLRRLDEEGGGLPVANSSSGVLNMAVLITLLWYSKVLVPGIDVPEDNFWQVQEQKLAGREMYDKILEMGYNNYVNSEIMPKIIDAGYFNKYLQIAGQHGEEIRQNYIDMGLVVMQFAMANMIPFEQLCGMRSLSKFYMDCYKIPDKLKEVSDFIFAETAEAKAKELEAVKDDPTFIGCWVGGWRTASAMLNPKIWESLVWPYMKASAEQLISYGKVAIMHLDQDWNRDIERFDELPAGKIVLNTDSMTNLPEARKKLPGHALMGDVPPTLLTTGKPQDVTDYVNRLIDEVGPAGLFVCPGCDCPAGAKYENVLAMIKATNEWR